MTYELKDNVIYVIKVLDEKGNSLRFDFNISTKILTTFSDTKADSILYEEKK